MCKPCSTNVTTTLTASCLTIFRVDLDVEHIQDLNVKILMVLLNSNVSSDSNPTMVMVTTATTSKLFSLMTIILLLVFVLIVNSLWTNGKPTEPKTAAHMNVTVLMVLKPLIKSDYLIRLLI